MSTFYAHLITNFNKWFAIGSFVIQKARAVDMLARIHSKPIVYLNNGGGRDTYIS